MKSDPQKSLEKFERLLLESPSFRIELREVWKAFLGAYSLPESTNVSEYLLQILKTLEASQKIHLPAAVGRHWHKELDLPSCIWLVDQSAHRSTSHRARTTWHAQLEWVLPKHMEHAEQGRFILRVNEGFINGEFLELKPFKFRSLQLTGSESGLESLMKTELFGHNRLRLDDLGCSPPLLPLAWEDISSKPQLLIVQSGPCFLTALQALRALKPSPFGLVALGDGTRIIQSINYLPHIARSIEGIFYWGDLDATSLRLVTALNTALRSTQLPSLKAAPKVYQAMVKVSASLGFPDGAPELQSTSPLDNTAIASLFLPPSIQDYSENLIRSKRRISSEILGFKDLLDAWSTSSTNSF